MIHNMYYTGQKSGRWEVPKWITSTTSKTKDTIIIVYFIPIDKKHSRI